jgi:hypothetical protein
MAYDFYRVALSVAAIIVSVAAIVVSLFLFRIGQRRTKKTEQVHICREIWIGIGSQNRFIHDWPLVDNDRIKLKAAMDSLKNDLGYFVFFVQKGEIDEPDILEYYCKRVSSVEKNMRLADFKSYVETGEILGLVRKYYELTDRVRVDKVPPL